MIRISLRLATVLLLGGCGAVTPPPPPAAPVDKQAQAPKAPDATPAKAAPPPAKPAAAAPKGVAPPPKGPATPAKSAAAPKAAPPPLDLKSLEQRLKETDAIGVLTKLSLKNQVDDLLDRFRAFHKGQQPPTLADLRRPFELLLMKALSLLQDKDAALARDINASREAIWGVLIDRDKLDKST